MTYKIPKIALAALCSAAIGVSAIAQSPKREFRSTWFTTVWNIDWPKTTGNETKQKAELKQYLDNLQAMNMTGICFQVRSMSDAVYKSSLEPWSSCLTGTRGKDPGYDPLEYVIEECHKRGLECYAWINPFRWSSGTDYNTDYDKTWKDNGWILNYGSYYVMNPAIKEARQHILDVGREIVTNYALDGVLWDDYFYPNNIPETSSADDYQLYKSSGTSLSIGDWRRENINSFVREFEAMIMEVKPDMRYGIGPAGVAGTSASKYGFDAKPVKASDWQYGTIYSDPLAWLNDGSIDFIAPQIYWYTTHSTAPYEPLCAWWSKAATKWGRHFYSSHSLSVLATSGHPTEDDYTEFETQVQLNRDYNADGVAPGSIYYSTKHFYDQPLSGISTALLENKYQNKSLTPVVTWKEHPSYGAPQNLKYSSSKLSWTKVTNGNANIRYTVYAIPLSVTYQKAMAENGDGIDGQYLLQVSYDTTFSVPSDKQSGYWYAVCVYDGYGYEYTPAVANYPEGTSSKVTLKSPVNGAKVDWTQDFSWSAVTGATYTITISESENGSTTSFDGVTYKTNSATLNLDDLKPSTKYYWAVLCQESSKIATLSDFATFTTPDYDNAPKVTLTAPANGYEPTDEITFEWSSAQDVSTYTIEVATDSSFKNVTYTSAVTAPQHSLTVNASTFGKGTFYWHIISNGKHLNPTTSDSRSFTITKLNVGNYEAGYAVKNDPATYEAVNDVAVKNLWMRSIKDGFENISFEEDGMLERGMVAVGDYVYLTRRAENKTQTNIYLEKYDAYTGEHIATVSLGEAALVSYYPCNNIVKDDKDNIIISNLSLNIDSAPLYLHLVNPETGALTEVASLSMSGLDKARVDHLDVTGDVTSGTFKVFAAMSGSNTIVRWNYSNGQLSSKTSYVVSEFYPSSASTFGVAPNIRALSSTEVLVNGGSIGLTAYNLSTKKLTSSVGDNDETASGSNEDNGICRFKLNNTTYTVFPWKDQKGSVGHQFMIATASGSSLSSMTPIAKIPADGLGTVRSSTASSPIDVVIDEDGSARVYVYAVGNGISAYRVGPAATVGVKSPSTDIKPLSITGQGMNIRLSRCAARINVYNTAGQLVATATDNDILAMNVPGFYIVEADGVRGKVILR